MEWLQVYIKESSFMRKSKPHSLVLVKAERESILIELVGLTTCCHLEIWLFVTGLSHLNGLQVILITLVALEH